MTGEGVRKGSPAEIRGEPTRLPAACMNLCPKSMSRFIVLQSESHLWDPRDIQRHFQPQTGLHIPGPNPKSK